MGFNTVEHAMAQRHGFRLYSGTNLQEATTRQVLSRVWSIKATSLTVHLKNVINVIRK